MLLRKAWIHQFFSRAVDKYFYWLGSLVLALKKEISKENFEFTYAILHSIATTFEKRQKKICIWHH